MVGGVGHAVLLPGQEVGDNLAVGRSARRASSSNAAGSGNQRPYWRRRLRARDDEPPVRHGGVEQGVGRRRGRAGRRRRRRRRRGTGRRWGSGRWERWWWSSWCHRRRPLAGTLQRPRRHGCRRCRVSAGCRLYGSTTGPSRGSPSDERKARMARTDVQREMKEMFGEVIGVRRPDPRRVHRLRVGPHQAGAVRRDPHPQQVQGADRPRRVGGHQVPLLRALPHGGGEAVRRHRRRGRGGRALHQARARLEHLHQRHAGRLHEFKAQVERVVEHVKAAA